MKKLTLLLMYLGAFYSIVAQAPTAATLQETAKSFVKSGDYDNAVLVLNKAMTMEPENKDIIKELVFASYLKRDFARAKELGETLIKKPDADVQSFHMLGLTYKAIADYKEAEKLYKAGLKKYPNEGILYSEYGEMLEEKNAGDGLKLFEKGIQSDINHSTNYYHVAKAYAKTDEFIWSIIYCEIFLNLESFTPRSTEIKNLLLDEYKKYFSLAGVKPFSDKKASDFIKAAGEVLNDQRSQISLGITPETLTALRTRFILQWYDKYAAKFPFRLFEHQRQLLQEGLFDSYNQWLFGPAANLATYQLWQKYHADDYNNYLAFVRGRVFKIPEGQQYNSF